MCSQALSVPDSIHSTVTSEKLREYNQKGYGWREATSHPGPARASAWSLHPSLIPESLEWPLRKDTGPLQVPAAQGMVTTVRSEERLWQRTAQPRLWFPATCEHGE